MKIGIDCRLWDETGVGRYIRNLVLNLQVIDKKNEYVLFILSKDGKNIKSLIHDSRFIIRFVDVKWHSIEEQLRLPVILNKENLDLMHFPYFSVPILYNRPYVVTIHDLIQSHYVSGRASKLPFFFYHLKRIGYQKVLKTAVSKAKKIMVPLFCVKEDLIKTLKTSVDKIVVTQEGFDAKIKEGNVSRNVSEATRVPYFLYVGNAYPHKNLETLINGFNKIKSKAKLILVGRDDYFYKRLKKNENNNLIFLHDVSDSDLFYLYSNAIANVSASLIEGFGLFPLEALGAGGIPVVSDIPAFREVCGDLAIYFNPKNEKDIAEKLKKALELKPAEREKIKEKARELVKKFSWEKMTKETLEIYNSLAL